jgi:ribosomal protein L15E
MHVNNKQNAHPYDTKTDSLIRWVCKPVFDPSVARGNTTAAPAGYALIGDIIK